MEGERYDAIVVGGRPVGLSAATAINEALTREDLARAGETLPEIYRAEKAAGAPGR